MKLILTFILALLCVPAFAQDQGESALLFPSGGGGGTLAYTGQNCTGATNVCSSAFTVATGDEIVVFGTNGSTSETLTSCSSATGTATATWTVITAATNIADTSNGESGGMCVGSVTAGGTVEPKMNWNSLGSDNSIVAAAISGSSSQAIEAGAGKDNAGSTGANANSSGTVTTTANGDMLVGGVADVSGPSATITAGTTSVAFTNIVCTTLWGGNTCLEYGIQATASSGTQAAWTFSAADRNIATIVALKP